MSPAAPASAVCPLCDGALSANERSCPHCHASPDWLELGSAAQFVQRRFHDWHRAGLLTPAQAEAIADIYTRGRQKCARLAAEGKPVPADAALPSRRRCWSCAAEADEPQEFCADCGAPWDTPAARSLRFLTFLGREITKQQKAGRLTLAQAHQCQTETRERLAALRQKLERARLPEALPAVSARPRRKAPAAPRRSLWEILLDPASIQWLLGLGGALLVVGLVLWLAARGLFADPRTMAVALGAGNGALLLLGWAVLTRTRYQTAGRALTLLACLVMPLNLWFYHTHNLVTLGQGLWLGGLVCCVLYLASALVLRDEMFVYVLLGGVALTGLLFLADLHLFAEIAAPATLLVALGVLAIHLERVFPSGEGPFTRSRFGLAFFWSGQALLASGLLLLLGGQLAGWLSPLTRAPAITTEPNLRLLAVGLVLLAGYAYVYSDVVVRRVGVYMFLAVFTLLWAEVLVLDLLGLTRQPEMVIALLALTALAAILLQTSVARGSKTLARTTAPLALFLAALPVGLGVLLHFRATNVEIHAAWPYTITWGYVGAMLLTALTCRLGAHLCRHEQPGLAATYFFGTAAATLAGAAGLLALLGLPTWDRQAVLLMLVPVLYLLAAQMYRGHTPEKPLVWVAHAATAFMVLGVITAALEITPQVFEPITGQASNLLLALFFAEAAVFYALAAGLREEGVSVYLGSAMACAALWQVLSYAGVAAEVYALTFAGLGFALLLGYRLAVVDRLERTGLTTAAFQSGNTLMTLACAAAVLLALARVALQQTSWPLVGLLLALTVLSLVAAGLVRHPVWRPGHFVMAAVEGMLLFVALEVLAVLGPWQKVELFCVVLGLVLLVLGHWGWYREQQGERQSELASAALFFGSLLSGLPLAVAVLIHRVRPEFSVVDEVGLAAVGIVLLASGFVFQLKSTTLTGASLLVLYVLTLVLFVHRLHEVQTAALLLAIGGGVVFGLGLLLSVYRDRLLTLPEKIKRREGVFRVLGWR
jgi:hypothetical protein